MAFLSLSGGCFSCVAVGILYSSEAVWLKCQKEIQSASKGLTYWWICGRRMTVGIPGLRLTPGIFKQSLKDGEAYRNTAVSHLIDKTSALNVVHYDDDLKSDTEDENHTAKTSPPAKHVFSPAKIVDPGMEVVRAAEWRPFFTIFISAKNILKK